MRWNKTRNRRTEKNLVGIANEKYGQTVWTFCERLTNKIGTITKRLYCFIRTVCIYLLRLSAEKKKKKTISEIIKLRNYYLGYLKIISHYVHPEMYKNNVDYNETKQIFVFITVICLSATTAVPTDHKSFLLPLINKLSF